MMDENKGPRKRFLALDTSTAILGVAITEEGRLLHEINASGERNHSVHLLPIIEQAMKDSGTDAAMLGGISVGVGPGSYTGTRIAVSCAKTLAWAWNVPVAGVSSLQAMAWGGYTAGTERPGAAVMGLPVQPDAAGEDWIIPLLDARRGQVYTALFAAGGSGKAPQRLEGDAIRLMADWVQHVAERLEQAQTAGSPPRSLWFVGETGHHGSEQSLLPLLESATLRVSAYELEGRWTGWLGEERLRQGESDDIHSLIPNYTQLTEAEANLRKAREGSLNER